MIVKEYWQICLEISAWLCMATKPVLELAKNVSKNQSQYTIVCCIVNVSYCIWLVQSSPVSESADDVPPPVPSERRVRTSASDQPPFVQCPWYYVGMSRNEAEQLLRTSGHKGSFLIRAGTSHVSCGIIFFSSVLVE